MCTASQRRRFRGQERPQRWSKAPARNRAVSDLANGRAVQRRLLTWAVLNAIKIAKNANDITSTLRPYGSLPSLASMGYVAARRAIRFEESVQRFGVADFFKMNVSVLEEAFCGG